MGDDNSNQKKRKSNQKILYLNIAVIQVNKRLGFRVGSVKGIPVATMLAGAQYSHEGLEATKEIVYARIVEYLQIAGYPTEGDPDFKESSVNNFVYSVIRPIIRNFIRTTGRRSIRLRTDKEIASEDGKTGGGEEVAVMDLILEDEEVFIFIIESKTTLVGKAMRQCFLAMKDARDNHNNGEGIVYGFITTGEDWRMIKYDGTFQMTEKFTILFDTVGENKDRWMKEGSFVVDCITVALSNGGRAKQDVLVEE